MKKSELKQLIREVVEEAKELDTMDLLKSDMQNSSFHSDFLENAAKLIQLAASQAQRTEYAMSELGPDVDPNDPTITRASVQSLYKQLRDLQNNSLLRGKGFKT